MKSKCIYTAIFNDYETLYDPLFPENDIDYICFTDDSTLKSDVWEIRFIENTISPSLFYKRFKCLVHKYLPNYKYTIWVDANFQIKIKNYFKYMLSYLKGDILLYQHFCLGGIHRNCIYREAEFSLGGKYTNEPIREQMETYFKEGYPKNNGLYQSGFLLRRDNCKKFNELWYDEICKWSVNTPQCQLSLPYSLWKAQSTFNVIDDDIIWNPEIYNIHNHKHSKVIFDNCIIEELKDKSKYKERKHFLIFGNDWTINDFPFDKLKNTDLITAGVNRIWKKYNCDYLYAMDRKIIQELSNEDVKINHLITPKYLQTNDVGTYEDFNKDFEIVKQKCEQFTEYKDYTFPHQGITWLIQTLEDIYKNYKCIFYVYGVSLKWQDKHHFWVGDKTITNTKDESYHLPIFDLYFRGFQQLKQTYHSRLISISKDSRLNTIFPYTEMQSLLERRTNENS